MNTNEFKFVKNAGQKIIHLEGLMILPGETKELPKAFRDNPMLDFWIKRGVLEYSAEDAEDIPAAKDEERKSKEVKSKENPAAREEK